MQLKSWIISALFSLCLSLGSSEALGGGSSEAQEVPISRRVLIWDPISNCYRMVPVGTSRSNSPGLANLQELARLSRTELDQLRFDTPSEGLLGNLFTWFQELMGNEASSSQPSFLLETVNSGIISGKVGLENTQEHSAVSDPVNVVTGEFYEDCEDLRLEGPLPLSLRRNYSSQSEAPSAFGWGWKINHVGHGQTDKHC